ncbi:MAG TPA: PA domain-containing protein, partial [Rubricoccaceae bacterium]|nr:PA domain-containing protein [Rubricoccaceae bacterium]
MPRFSLIVALVLLAPASRGQEQRPLLEVEVLQPEMRERLHGAGPAAFGPVPWAPVEGDVVPVGVPGDSSEYACRPIEEDLAGRIAVIRRGGCTFVTKVRHAQAAGAAAALIFNNVPPGSLADTLLMEMGGIAPDVTIPSGFVRAALGVLLREMSPGARIRLEDSDRCWDYTPGTPDPTEPYRYYPLVAGNAWEYTYTYGPPPELTDRFRLDVLRDTLIAGEAYAVIRDARYNPDNPQTPTEVSTVLVRFDTLTARMVRRYPGGTEFEWDWTPCPFDADDGEMINTCPYRSFDVAVYTESMPIGDTTYSFEAKRYGSCYSDHSGDPPHEVYTYARDV